MILWLAAGALTLVFVLVLARPLWTAPRADAGAAHDIEVYRDQLAELQRDLARGIVPAREAEAARLEIERRIVRAAAAQASAGRPDAGGAPARPPLALLLALALGLPFGAGAVYVGLGAPGLPGQPHAARDEVPRDPALARRLAALEAKADANPNGLDDRLALADALLEAQLFRRAAAAYRQALALAGGRGDIASLYGEALVRAASGVVTAEARQVFELALRQQPADPRAQYFLGLAEVQAGRARQGLERWLRLEAQAPAEAQWVEHLRREMKRVADESGLTLATLRQEMGLGGRGPSESDMRDAEKMSPDERMAMIRGMIGNLEARLKDNPGDLEGWKRLGRSYGVLGEHAKSAAAYGRAAALAPGDVPLLQDYAAALIRANPDGRPVPAEAVAVLKKIRAAEPDNALALFYLGIAAAESGDNAEAIVLFKRLLERLPADAPIRAMVEKRLKEAEGR